MKKLILGIAVLLFSATTIAQNTNQQTETKTTVRTVKDSDGAHQTVKEVQTKEVQKIELGEEKPNTLNINMVDSPVEKVAITQITNPDGTTRTVGVDRSSNYEFDGKKYQVSLDASGYTIADLESNKVSLLRKTSTNSFIYRNKNKIAVGYFDTNGNLILENYDSKMDKVTTETYILVK